MSTESALNTWDKSHLVMCTWHTHTHIGLKIYTLTVFNLSTLLIIFAFKSGRDVGLQLLPFYCASFIWILLLDYYWPDLALRNYYLLSLGVVSNSNTYNNLRRLLKLLFPTIYLYEAKFCCVFKPKELIKMNAEAHMRICFLEAGY